MVSRFDDILIVPVKELDIANAHRPQGIPVIAFLEADEEPIDAVRVDRYQKDWIFTGVWARALRGSTTGAALAGPLAV